MSESAAATSGEVAALRRELDMLRADFQRLEDRLWKLMLGGLGGGTIGGLGIGAAVAQAVAAAVGS